MSPSAQNTAPESFMEIGSGQDEFLRATWPFVKLTVAHDRLQFSLIGRKYDLTPADVVAIEPRVLFRLLDAGILIVFIRAGRTHFLWFFSFSGAENLLLKIRNVGFVPAAHDDGVRPRGVPIRGWVFALPVVVWAVMMFDFNRSHGPGLPSFVLLVTALVASVALFRSKLLQRIILRPGRVMTDIRSGVLLLALLTGLALAITVTLACLTWLRPDIWTHPPVESAPMKTHEAPLSQ